MALLIKKKNTEILEIKKLKASTLMEVIVATVIIIVIFGIATLTINNIIKNTYQKQTQNITKHLNQKIYYYQNGKITIPFQEEYKQWDVSIEKQKRSNKNYIVFIAKHKQTQKEITKQIIHEQ